MNSGFPLVPIGTLPSWPPQPTVVRGLLLTRLILFINNFVCCLLAMLAMYPLEVLLIGVFMSLSFPFIFALMYWHYRLLPPAKKSAQHVPGIRYSALGIREDHLSHLDGPNQETREKGMVKKLKLCIAVDSLGTFIFVLMYGFSMASITDRWRREKILQTYANIGALVAFIIHTYCIIVEARLLMAHKNSLRKQCPHCRHMVDHLPAETHQSPIRLPENGPHQVRERYTDDVVDPQPGQRQNIETDITQSTSSTNTEAQEYDLINKV